MFYATDRGLQGAAKIGIFALNHFVPNGEPMSNEKPFRKINELLTSLSDAGKGLNDGSLRLDALEAACDDARELYERLIVLRHKARELAASAAPSVQTTRPEAPKPKEGPAPTARVSEAVPVRLDTRPAPEAGPRQTSLIEAIEHTEKAQVQPPSPAKEPERKPGAPSVAEKLEKAAVADLGKAISLSHKFWFVAELFNGDRIAFDTCIDRLNAMNDLSEARAFVQAEVIAKLRKPADPEALSTFNELVQRRYA